MKTLLEPARAPASAEDEHAPLRLALAGGGTGGHLVPGLHLLDELAQGGGTLADLVWLHGSRPVEERVLARLPERARTDRCERVPLALEPPGGGAPHPAGVCARLPRAVHAARRALAEHETEVVLGLGGFVSVPALLAARSLAIPTAMLEVNATAGRATRALAPLCARVLHAWPGSMPVRSGARHRCVGPPLAPEFAPPRDETERRAARARLGVAPDRPLLVVLGGSQGAGGLNRFVREELARLLARGASVLHQLGPERIGEAGPTCAHYYPVEFLDDVAGALRGADAALCRGGASTLAELAAARVPAVVVPYPHHADRHQERNAAALGAGVVISPEHSLGPALADHLAWLASADAAGERERMREGLAAALPSGGARRILAELAELARTLRWKRRARSSGMRA